MNIKMGNGSSILMSNKGESVKSIFQDDKYIIAKQAEQINIMRDALLMIIDLQTYDQDDSHHMVNAAEQAIEAIKEQA